MPLLGIGKKQQSVQEPVDIPDELPDLPQDAEQTAQNAGAEMQDGGVPDELPPVDSLAPDELPPVDGSVDGSDPGFNLSGAPRVDDKRLFFSSMLQKLNEEGINSTKLTTPSANLLTDMKKHWKQRKKEDELASMRQKVAESITPLQKLEQEWVALQTDIEQKRALLHEKEEEIRKLAEDAKELASKAERMKVK